MKLFTGIAFDEPQRAELTRAISLVRPLVDAKWELPQKAHLTLVFLGEADRAETEARMKDVASRHPAFDVRLKGSGHFDDRVLWLGVEAPLTALHAELERVLEKPNNYGGYSPHVTVARAKRAQRGLFAGAVKALAGFEAPAMRVDRITLFESRDGQYFELAHGQLKP